MFISSFFPRLGPQEEAGQVTQKAYGSGALPTATRPESCSWPGTRGMKEKGIHIC